MAAPLSADALVRALRGEGVRVAEHGDWKTHNRNHKGPWGPVHGVMLHHTAGVDSLALCRDGIPSLPGPLCVGLLTKDGTVHLVGHGRTNHAGNGSAAVLEAVRAERPLPARGPDTVDGNARFYGFEIENLGNGRDPYPAAQLDAAERLSAALCRAHGWSARSVVAHKEWTRRKVDPSFSMSLMRDRVSARLRSKPAPPAPPPGPGTPPEPAYETFPGAAFFVPGRSSPLITSVGRRLVAEGCGRYDVGPGPVWGAADNRSYAAWQRKLGYRGADADGIPGRASWERLRVPRTGGTVLTGGGAA
ncbi:peptidoglycan-binding protein [Streptomyces liangshanensis]|uniref:N-acetylmuramoyl-L-alanine amidase n=1 Tax=Streptomyces liangshanensis TaxID=2717324 RepID=A0A6G9H307_9ACTN|nr:peptidoglycan-binding protein [Streptomyces liangshanensis]QIQ04696.1 N-acetylmuramoyl-L-alanine amidase [Streptomyces liangshanensis]